MSRAKGYVLQDNRDNKAWNRSVASDKLSKYFVELRIDSTHRASAPAASGGLPSHLPQTSMPSIPLVASHITSECTISTPGHKHGWSISHMSKFASAPDSMTPARKRGCNLPGVCQTVCNSLLWSLNSCASRLSWAACLLACSARAAFRVSSWPFAFQSSSASELLVASKDGNPLSTLSSSCTFMSSFEAAASVAKAIGTCSACQRLAAVGKAKSMCERGHIQRTCFVLSSNSTSLAVTNCP
mmetsp:Transcript_12999/g.29500  ORF Transcript_12999/g.29500 Transcript_12999/m.29500 type:complete len:242 (-) Transcript_12999:819-1544(-)